MAIQLRERHPMPILCLVALFDAERKYAGRPAPTIAKRKLIRRTCERLSLALPLGRWLHPRQELFNPRKLPLTPRHCGSVSEEGSSGH